jgi:hypothetical protein
MNKEMIFYLFITNLLRTATIILGNSYFVTIMIGIEDTAFIFAKCYGASPTKTRLLFIDSGWRKI